MQGSVTEAPSRAEQLSQALADTLCCGAEINGLTQLKLWVAVREHPTPF